MPLVPFRWRRDAIRGCDRQLGRRAAEIANLRHAALLSYSYYAHSAFSSFRGTGARILFQLHPHPASMRRILREELDRHPECATSLNKEWELGLAEEDFRRLVEETQMADHWLVASSFTKQTLVENGIPAERIQVIPYGTEVQRFTPGARKPGGPLRLLFIGTICQRKGVADLLEALDRLPCGSAELTVCGRMADDAAIFQNHRMPTRVRRFLNSGELLSAYRAADVFVLPSLGEGFGHVLLEAMACGLPVISTTRTAAPDLICPGREGFVIEPGNPAELAKCIEYFLQDPSRITSMAKAARARAEYFTWERFRSEVANTVRGILEQSRD
jgi:glycosyltransferase involved in cell wall biosynthesis